MGLTFVECSFVVPVPARKATFACMKTASASKCNRAIGTTEVPCIQMQKSAIERQLVTPWVRLIESLVQLEVVILFMMFLWKVHSQHILTKTFIFFQAEISFAVPDTCSCSFTASGSELAALESIIPNFYFQPTTMDGTEGKTLGYIASNRLLSRLRDPSRWLAEGRELEVFNFD